MCAIWYEGDEREGDHFQVPSEASRGDGVYGSDAKLGLATPGFEPMSSRAFGGAGLQHEPQAREGEEGPMDLSREFYATLAEAPQASLIHLVSLYHQTLLRHGLVEDAENITSVLAGLQNQEEAVEREELIGMDLLLKEGLLKYLMSIHPYLPPVPHQVDKLLPSVTNVLLFSVTPLSTPSPNGIILSFKSTTIPLSKPRFAED